MRMALAAALMFTLAACGQGGPPPQAATASPPAAPQPTPAEWQAKVAALPAPYNQARYDNGRTVFAQCMSCHTINAGGINMVGPNLHGVVGRRIASVAGYNYSPAVQSKNFVWDADHLEQWLSGPSADIPGTRMSFPGVRDATQRRDLIAYLMVNSEP
jgi:cytochrome c